MSIITKAIKAATGLCHATGMGGILRHRLRHKLVILLYHGVTSSRSINGIRNNIGTHIFAHDFEQQIAHIAAHHRFTSLPEAVDKIKKGEPFDSRGEVVITFDDGYKNNLAVALPILQKYGVRPAVFVTTGFVGTSGELWTDLVERFVANTKIKNSTMSIGRQDVTLIFESNDEKLESLDRLKSALKQCTEKEKERVLKKLRAMDATEKWPTTVDDEMLSWDDIRKLSVHADIGSHGVSHALLSQLSPQQAHKEIIMSKKVLESKLKKNIVLYAYPTGRLGDFAADNKEMLHQAGYRCALSTIRGTYRSGKGADLFELCRMSMGGHIDFVSFLARLYFQLYV